MKLLSVFMLFFIIVNGYPAHHSNKSQSTSDGARVLQTDFVGNDEESSDKTTEDTNSNFGTLNLESNNQKKINDELYNDYEGKDSNINERSYLIIGHLYKKSEVAKDSSLHDTPLTQSKYAKIKLNNEIEFSKKSESDKKVNKTLFLNNKEYISSVLKMKLNNEQQNNKLTPCEYLLKESEFDSEPDELIYRTFNGIEVLKKACAEKRNSEYISEEYLKSKLLNQKNIIQDKIYKVLKMNNAISNDRRVSPQPNLSRKSPECACKNGEENKKKIIKNGTLEKCGCKNR